MKTGRNIIIGAILTLGAGAGAIIPAAATLTGLPVSVVVAGAHAPGTHYYGEAAVAIFLPSPGCSTRRGSSEDYWAARLASPQDAVASRGEDDPARDD